jgi:hypothetical protein
VCATCVESRGEQRRAGESREEQGRAGVSMGEQGRLSRGDVGEIESNHCDTMSSAVQAPVSAPRDEYSQPEMTHWE